MTDSESSDRARLALEGLSLGDAFGQHVFRGPALKLDSVSSAKAASVLGNGSEVTGPDSVPFAIWAALGSLGDFERAMWLTMEGLLEPDSDRDTIGAIVGGIVAMSVGASGLPKSWIAAREKLPIDWQP